MLELWYGTFVLEGVLYYMPPLWRFRRAMSLVIAVYIVYSSYLLGQYGGLLLAIPLYLLLVFRLGNLGRILKNRMHSKYMRRATSRTTLGLLIIHSALFYLLIIPMTATQKLAFQTVLYLQIIVAFSLLAFTLKNIIKLKVKLPEAFLSDQELPTLTVAIPARNETTDLEECLRSIIANDYPKLEIIVLDDCSGPQTADIIRKFANQGVRFVKGHEPHDRWLAKNQAYQKLYEQSSGDLILFCGVDVRFSPTSIRNLVNIMHSRNKSMISILPSRNRSSSSVAFIQPMRYWWELAFPRRLFNKPAVLSTCWMIVKNELDDIDGFSSVSHSIIPEGVFARSLVKRDKYSFIRSSNEIEISTVKPLSEQFDTAVRTRYPQVRKRPENVIVLIVLELVFLVAPFILLIFGLLTKSDFVLPSLFSCLLLILAHISIVNATNPSNSLLAVFNLPVVILVEILVGFVSMIRYEFSKVVWKDRNICIPVMHVIPKLPELDVRR